jgi:hypothetical protein
MGLHLHLNPEQFVDHYECVVDGATPVSVTPEADGSADFDLSAVAPGTHTVSARAINATGTSDVAYWPFSVTLPVPAIPTGSVVDQ